jgi:filamentous hemagglutinin family protein
MRCMTWVLACVGGLALATGAGAETYSLLEGTITDTATGETEPLTGAFDASLLEPDGSVEPQTRTLLVDDFAFQARARSFLPRQPIEFQGLTPIFFLEVADQIHPDGDAVAWLRLRSGGHLVAASADEVTFRYLDFRSDGSGRNRAVGSLPDSDLPRRFHLRGTLHEVDQSFRVLRVDEHCALLPPPIPVPVPLPPPPGGGGVNLFVSFETFDIDPSMTVEFRPPAGGGAPIHRVIGGDPGTIGGELREDGPVSLFLVDPLRVGPGSVPASSSEPSTLPTLEELGISAPDGAEVTFDANGVLSVTSEGDLYMEGVFPEIPGLTSVHIHTRGSVFVTGAFEVPPGVALQIDAGGIGIADDASVIGEPIIIGIEPPIIITPFCNGLRPLFPAQEREVGTFSLIASVARPVEIDVRPRRRHNRLRLGSRQMIPVALLGSGDLDVRDVDEGSLRLGPGEAEPLGRRGRRWILRVDVNSDRHVDLLALFDIRDTEVAFGDTHLCLVAETEDGALIEGCDAIDTWPEMTRHERLRRKLR